MKVRLVSAPSRRLREMFGRGECDVILTTEETPGPGGEALVKLPLVWIGADGGSAWKQRPLPVAFCSSCIFKSDVSRRLDSAMFDWELVVDSDLDNAVEAVVSADLAIHAAIQGHKTPGASPIEHGGELPDPGNSQIILYSQTNADTVFDAMRDLIRRTYSAQSLTADLSRIA